MIDDKSRMCATILLQIRKILRLDSGRGAVATAPQATPDFSSKGELGNVEEAVMSTWAGEDIGMSEDEPED